MGCSRPENVASVLGRVGSLGAIVARGGSGNANGARRQPAAAAISAGLDVAEPEGMRNINHSRVPRVVLVAALLPLAACATPPAYQPPQRTQAVRAVETPRRTDPPEPLSPAARELLKARMASHGRDMNDLVSAIMVLDYVTLARPVSHDATELNASLPEKFFVHQDNVKVEARALADAARAHDAYRVAEQYGRLSEGCVRCHADYRPRN